MFLETFVALSPLYFYILTGVLLRKTNVIDGEFLPAFNRLAFHAFLPLMMFLNIYEADLDFHNSIAAITYVIAAYVVLFSVLMLIVPRFIKDKPRAATAVQAMFRSNFVLLGLLYARQLFGTDCLGEVTILVAVIVPLFNVLAVICFTLLTGKKQSISGVLIKIMKNPLILATLAGFLVRAMNIELSALLLDPISTLANVATPFVMVVIGASLTLTGFKNEVRIIGAATVVRLVAVPLVFVTVAIFLGFREATLIALLTAFGGPCAASSAAMAYQLGGDGELASQLLAVTTIFSLPTMYLLIVLLKGLGLC